MNRLVRGTRLPIVVLAAFLALSAAAQGSDWPFERLLARLRALSEDARGDVVREYLEGRRMPVAEQDTLLTFVWFGRADSVLLNGSLLSGWRQPVRMHRLACGSAAESPSMFYRSFAVPRDALIEYQFIINGQPVLDPRNVRTTPDGDFRNSQAALPGFRPSPWTAVRPGVPAGTFDTLDFRPRDPQLAHRRVIVYLPPGFTQGKTLPSLYVHDGPATAAFSFLPRILDNMIHARLLPPLIAVLVPPVERRAEYVGRKQVLFRDALAGELVPIITARYGASTSAARRGIIGISNGGHAALAAGLARPEVFGLCAGQSSTITGALDQLVSLRARVAPLPLNFRLYLECGRYDIVDAELDFPQLNREFHERLLALKIAHVYRETSGGHDWPSWRETLPDILRYLFAHQGTPPDVLPAVPAEAVGR